MLKFIYNMLKGLIISVITGKKVRYVTTTFLVKTSDVWNQKVLDFVIEARETNDQNMLYVVHGIITMMDTDEQNDFERAVDMRIVQQISMK